MNEYNKTGTNKENKQVVTRGDGGGAKKVKGIKIHKLLGIN